jgi:uncharacterized phage protein gp47/JayE
MAVAPSFSDLVTVGTAELQAARPDLLVAEGDVTLAMLHAAAAMNDAVLRYAAQSFKNTFVDGASGDDLTTLVDDHFNIQRQAASAAEVTLTFTRATASAGSGTIDAGTVVATDFDANGEAFQFETDTALVFSAAQLTGDVVATCTTTGRDTNVAAGTITRLIDTLFDTTITCTNAAVAGGGNDEETDAELRSRTKLYLQSLRRGTLASLETGALQVPTVRMARAVEDPDTFLVILYVSDADGNSTPEMISDVETEIVNWKAAGTSLTVTGGTQVPVDFNITIDSYRDGFDVAANAPTIEEALEGRLAKIRAGETVYMDSVIAAVIATFPEDIYAVSVTATVAAVETTTDIVPTATEVIRAGTITVT